MKITHIINEGLSSILYHSTGLHSVLKILDNNKFRLTPDLGSSSESDLRAGKKDKIYYMSFSRSAVGDYNLNTVNALLVIDGDKLSHKFSGSPVDYWGSGYDKDEMEDRLYSKKPYIENAADYIKSIHVYYDENSYAYDNAKRIRWLRKCYILSKQYGIKFYVYVDKAAYQLLDIRKSVPISTLKYDRDIVLDKPYVSYYTSSYDDLIELLSVSDINKLSKAAHKLLDKIRYDSYGDMPRQLSANIHNDKSGNDSTRSELDKFLRLVLSLRLHSVGDILKYIREKFKLQGDN